MLDLAGEFATILRPGGVTADQIAAIIGRPVGHFAGSVGSGKSPPAPASSRSTTPPGPPLIA